jgi:hypothetical protein
LAPPHRQTLFSQLQAPGPQPLPQAPQLATSDEVSTQAFPHRSAVGAAHSKVHAPSTQLWPEAQMLPFPPHFPQWASSVERLTHLPLQLVWPSGQQMPPPQVPPPAQEPWRSTQVQLEAAVQARQAPAQAVAQQCPATQAFDSQSFPLRHVPPSACLTGGAQSPSMQTSAPPQDWFMVWQEPLGLQVLVTRRLSAAQSAPPHTLPAFSRAQAPPPSQPLEQASSRHEPEGSAPPRGTFEHLPSLPATAQDMQVELQGPSQQRPCAQTLLSQSAALLHEAPSGRLPQSPAVQTLGEVHCESLPQLSAQRLPAQPWNGAQLRAAGVLHWPPSQMPAGVSLLAEALHFAGRQTVLSG